MADGQGTILMTDARYDKHVNAAPLDIIADLGSRRPEKVGALREKRFQKCPAANLAAIWDLVRISRQHRLSCQAKRTDVYKIDCNHLSLPINSDQADRQP
jgi:hypothetical protein